MSNSHFDKNDVDNSGTHWLQYTAFVVTTVGIIFVGHFLMNLIFITLLSKYSSFGIAMDITLKVIA